MGFLCLYGLSFGWRGILAASPLIEPWKNFINPRKIRFIFAKSVFADLGQQVSELGTLSICPNNPRHIHSKLRTT